MKKRIPWLMLSLLVVVALVLGSCAPAATTTPAQSPTSKPTPTLTPTPTTPAAEEPRYGGVYRYADREQIVGFDEAYGSIPDTRAVHLTHETLLTGDWSKGMSGTGESMWMVSTMPIVDLWTGMVAESWEIPQPGTTIYHIRKGIHFGLDPDSEASRLVGGRELTAEDVVFSINRIYNIPTSQVASIAPRGQKPQASAADKYTVVVKCSPDYTRGFLEDLGGKVRMIAHEVIEKYGDLRNWKAGVGTGPFFMTDFVSGTSITYERNPNYWGKDPLHPENTLPYLDGVSWLLIPDWSTMLTALRTAKIDSLAAISKDEAFSLMKSTPELKWIKALNSSTDLLYMRNDSKPFDDIRVRRALFMGIDFKSIVEGYYGEGIYPAYPVTPWPEWRDVYIPLGELPESTQELYTYHPDKAKQLLAEAGYPRGFNTNVICYQDYVDILTIIKAYWADIGVDLKIDLREKTAWNSVVSKRSHDQMIIRYLGNANPIKWQAYRRDNLQNLSIIEDEYADSAFIDMQEHWEDTPYVNKKLKEDYIPYVLDKAWFIDLPVGYVYTMWWPWVKNHHGEYSLGITGYMRQIFYIWIDQDLKKEILGR